MEISNFYRETYDPVDSVILSGPRAEASIQPASNHKSYSIKMVVFLQVAKSREIECLVASCNQHRSGVTVAKFHNLKIFKISSPHGPSRALDFDTQEVHAAPRSCRIEAT